MKTCYPPNALKIVFTLLLLSAWTAGGDCQTKPELDPLQGGYAEAVEITTGIKDLVPASLKDTALADALRRFSSADFMAGLVKYCSRHKDPGLKKACLEILAGGKLPKGSRLTYTAREESFKVNSKHFRISFVDVQLQMDLHLDPKPLWKDGKWKQLTLHTIPVSTEEVQE